MVNKEFNLNGEALRKLLVVAVDVSEGKSTPEWEVQGYKTEELSPSRFRGQQKTAKNSQIASASWTLGRMNL